MLHSVTTEDQKLHFVYNSLRIKTVSDFLCTSMMYLRSQFHVTTYISSFVITIRPKAKRSFLLTAMTLSIAAKFGYTDCTKQKSPCVYAPRSKGEVGALLKSSLIKLATPACSTLLMDCCSCGNAQWDNAEWSATTQLPAESGSHSLVVRLTQQTFSCV
jgi:hypothetical protein